MNTALKEGQRVQRFMAAPKQNIRMGETMIVGNGSDDRKMYVLQWFDDEETMPAVYAVRRPDGRYDAVTSEANDEKHEVVEIVLATFDTANQAIQCLWAWNVDEARGQLQ